MGETARAFTVELLMASRPVTVQSRPFLLPALREMIRLEMRRASKRERKERRRA